MGRRTAPAAPRYVLGIDPGVTGGIALMREDAQDVCVSTCPGKGDVQQMAEHVRELLRHYGDEIVVAIMEEVHAAPQQGAVSGFTFGRGAGRWDGILAMAGISVIEVSPQKWQIKELHTHLDANKKINTKKLSCKIASLKYPQIKFYGPQGGLIDGKADAVHLARYGVRWLKGEVE